MKHFYTLIFFFCLSFFTTSYLVCAQSANNTKRTIADTPDKQSNNLFLVELSPSVFNEIDSTLSDPKRIREEKIKIIQKLIDDPKQKEKDPEKEKTRTKFLNEYKLNLERSSENK